MRGLQRARPPLGADGVMSCADSIAKMLADAHFSCYFSNVSPSALDCPEPIVVLGARSRGSRGWPRRSAGTLQ